MERKELYMVRNKDYVKAKKYNTHVNADRLKTAEGF